MVHSFESPPEKDAAKWDEIVQGLMREQGVGKLLSGFYKTVRVLVLRKDGSLVSYGSNGKPIRQLLDQAKSCKVRNVYALYDDYVAETEDGKLIGTGACFSVEKIRSYSRSEWVADIPALLIHFADDRTVMCSHRAEAIENVRKIVPFGFGHLLLGTSGRIVAVGTKDEEIKRLNKAGKIADILTFGKKNHQNLAVLYRSGKVLIDGKPAAKNVRNLEVVRDRLYADFRTDDSDMAADSLPVSNEDISVDLLENFPSFPPEEVCAETVAAAEDAESEIKLQELAQAVLKTADIPEQYSANLYNMIANIYGYGSLLCFNGYAEEMREQFKELQEQFFDWEYPIFIEALASPEIIKAMSLDAETMDLLFHSESLQDRIFDIYYEQVSNKQNHQKVADYFKRIVAASPRYGRLMRKAVRYLADEIGVDI